MLYQLLFLFDIGLEQYNTTHRQQIVFVCIMNQQHNYSAVLYYLVAEMSSISLSILTSQQSSKFKKKLSLLQRM